MEDDDEGDESFEKKTDEEGLIKDPVAMVAAAFPLLLFFYHFTILQQCFPIFIFFCVLKYNFKTFMC